MHIIPLPHYFVYLGNNQDIAIKQSKLKSQGIPSHLTFPPFPIHHHQTLPLIPIQPQGTRGEE